MTKTADENYKNKITKFYKKHHRMPTYSEISAITGLASKNAVYKLIERLRVGNFLSKDSKGHLLPKAIFGEIRLLGLVEAGFPSAAEEETIDTMSLDEYLIDNKEATFMLKVKGDSMIDAGIHEGDMVIVERNVSPRIGDIVIADVDGEWTMKYFKKRGDKVYLEAANPKYKDIIPEESLKIAATVKAVVRKYL